MQRTDSAETPDPLAAARDYFGIARRYARQAADEKHAKRYGKRIRKAARRFLDDLDAAKLKACPWVWDTWEAENACDFIEKLPHVEGVWDTPHLLLCDADVWFVCNLFGFRKRERDKQGYRGRRFTEALLCVGRKNAKSTKSAAIALYVLCCEPEEGAQLISAATTGDQARIIWEVARKMVDKTPDLADAYGLQTFANAITHKSVGGNFRPINAKASTQDGLNPSMTALDEIHAHKSHDLLNVIRSAAGGRRNPLYLYTTTEGYESPGPWPEMRRFADKVLDGIVQADHMLIAYYSLDPDDDDFDEQAWHKANPILDANPTLLEQIRTEAIRAKSMPGALAEFRIKRLNRTSSSAKGWIEWPKWERCKGPVDLEFLRRFKCYGGLDLASTQDIASFRLVWDVDGMLYSHGWRFVPEAAVAMRTERGAVPYAGWVASGKLIQTPGEVTNYDVIRQCVVQANENFDLQMVGYDQWNAAQLTSKLKEEDGVPMEIVIQGAKSMHPAMQEFERRYVTGQFRHGDDPVLNWNASNIIARRDANTNMAPDKQSSMEKIDDMVALLIAVAVMERHGNEGGEASLSGWIKANQSQPAAAS